MIFKKPDRLVNKVFIHCSASDRPEHDDVYVIRKWHLERGFRDVGYHAFVQKSGYIQEGRPMEHVPAAQEGHNAGSIAICLAGLNDFTGAQFRALQSFCAQIKQAIPNVTFHGHKEVSNKTCPNFSYQDVLALDERGRMGELPEIPLPWRD